MSVNKFAPHVLALPEDDANSQIANGFQLGLSPQKIRKLQILPEAGGWIRVRDLFLDEHVRDLERYPERHMVLLIDMDGRNDRVAEVMARVPSQLSSRVFVLGARTTPEELRIQVASTFESIGQALAQDCSRNTVDTWGHPLLRHNIEELTRMRATVFPILFGEASS